MINQSELKELLHYEPDTGIFTWKVSLNRKIKIGSIAGTKNKYWGYIYIGLKQKKYRAHRLAWFYMTGEWPKGIDHDNHIRDDNRWLNLKEATQSKNTKNQSLRKDNKSGFTGVCWCDKWKKWVAKINVNGKTKYLGNSDNLSEAIKIRKTANIKYGFHRNHGVKNCA